MDATPPLESGLALRDREQEIETGTDVIERLRAAVDDLRTRVEEE